MKHREFKPQRLDIQAFVVNAGELQGQIALTDLPRLGADLHSQASPQDVAPVRWQARGEARPRRTGAPELWLHLQTQASVPLECQRCLQPVDVALQVDRWFHFVETEALAAELDETSDDDVLVQSSAFNLLELVEDELLLALPVVPNHEQCPTQLPFNPDSMVEPEVDQATEEAEPHPFAALAALKKSAGPQG
ncbi:MAG: DUF177 domain-containing protein [Leptothrix sp. (in: b-proteobacteria)]